MTDRARNARIGRELFLSLIIALLFCSVLYMAARHLGVERLAFMIFGPLVILLAANSSKKVDLIDNPLRRFMIAFDSDILGKRILFWLVVLMALSSFSVYLSLVVKDVFWAETAVSILAFTISAWAVSLALRGKIDFERPVNGQRSNQSDGRP